MKILKRGILYLGSLAEDLVLAWPMVLVVWLLWGTDLQWVRGVLRCQLKPESWPLGGKQNSTGYLVDTRSMQWSSGWKSWLWPRGWYIHNRYQALFRIEQPRSWGGTSVGHGQFFGRDPGPGVGPRSPLVVHEEHHTLQAEAANLAAFALAIGVFTMLATYGHWSAAAWTAVAIWTLGGNVAVSCGGWAASWLRSDPRGPYRGSPHEIGARGVGEFYKRNASEP